jgi:hypothetical protein
MRNQSIKQIASVIGMVAAVMLAPAIRASVITDSALLPPLYPYIGQAELHAVFNGPFPGVPQITNIVLGTIRHTPVNRGLGTNNLGNYEEVFDSIFNGDATVKFTNGSSVFGSLSGTGSVYVTVSNYPAPGSFGTFTTEMTAMNVSAIIALPGTNVNFSIHESVTKTTLGLTTVSNAGGGKYNVDSWFDVWPSISFPGYDEYYYWVDATNSVHVVLTDIIPTVPQWGMIVMGLLLLAVGIVFLLRRQRRVMASTGGG